MDEEENPCEHVEEIKRCDSTNDTSTNRRKKKEINRRSRKISKIDRLEKNSIPIFTDAFIHLYRQQKSEIRSLKLSLNELSEKVKLRDAQQEQIRLNNHKMRRDIEEISSKNLFFEKQIEIIEKEFVKTFEIDEKHLLIKYLHENVLMIHKSMRKSTMFSDKFNSRRISFN